MSSMHGLSKQARTYVVVEVVVAQLPNLNLILSLSGSLSHLHVHHSQGGLLLGLIACMYCPASAADRH